MDEFRDVCFPDCGRIAINQVGLKAGSSSLSHYSIGGETMVLAPTNSYYPTIAGTCKPWDAIENYCSGRFEFTGECLHYKNYENDDYDF